jgi:hypothetical protein
VQLLHCLGNIARYDNLMTGANERLRDSFEKCGVRSDRYD